MMIYILVVVASIIIGVLIGYFRKDDMGVYVLASIAIGLLIGYIVVFNVSINLEYIDKQNNHCYLYNLQDDSQVNGSFSLGTGRIQETQYFVFYTKDKYGFKYSKLEASRCRIQESDGKPVLVRVVREQKNPNFFTKGLAIYPDVEWIFKVPKNTVIREFNLDLQ